jgi:4-amino-4-deoxy-L-arabinose transferase-like glycosyltransferase
MSDAVSSVRVLDGGPRRETLALTAIVLLGALLRLWGLFHDLPFSYYGDELHFMKLSVAMGTGDLNPHWFHKPAFLMYVLALVYGLYFVAGLALGRFHSTAELGAHFLTDYGPFLLLGRLVVCACGVATIVVVHRIARRAFGDARAGLAAAFTAAVLTPMIVSSQTIKSDVPSGLLIALSVLVYLRTREDDRWRPLVWAGLLAGAAMGAHYYGVVLVPAYAAMELWNGAVRRFPWRLALLRAALLPALFVAGFFVTSPYNFLDPSWARANLHHVRETFFPEPHKVLFEPDKKVTFQPGTSQAFGGAAVNFVEVLTSSEALGVGLTLLVGLGLAASLARRETRWYGLLVLVPVLLFFLAAITVAAYHVQPRHLNAIFPLLATLVWPGAWLVARRLPARRERLAGLVAAALVGLACVPAVVEAARLDRELTRVDSRLVSYRWIAGHLRDGRILLDDYGPTLQPSPAAAERQEALLRTLPKGPFTEHQARRLELLRRFPPSDGLDIVELGHPWWLPREKSDEELRRDPTDLDMGNPLVSRQPRPLAWYRVEGIRYVVTNSEARGKYFGRRAEHREGFPTFVHFYRELDGLTPIRTFDPREWGGKGPVVRVYDLARPPAPAPPRGDQDDQERP